MGAVHHWRQPTTLNDVVPRAHRFIARDQGVPQSGVRIMAVDPNPRHDPDVIPEVEWRPEVPTHLVHAVYEDRRLGTLKSIYGVSTKRNYIRHLDAEPFYKGDDVQGRND